MIRSSSQECGVSVLSSTCSFGSVLEKKLAAEEYIKKRHSQADASFPAVKTETTRLRSGLDYTIIRPARLPEGMGQKCMARALMYRCQCPTTSPEMRLCCNIISQVIIATFVTFILFSNPDYCHGQWARNQSVASIYATKPGRRNLLRKAGLAGVSGSVTLTAPL